MVLSFMVHIELLECGYDNASGVVLIIGIVFFWIANICYTNLKDEIKELKKEIGRIQK
jgi:hypothetical protein